MLWWHRYLSTPPPFLPNKTELSYRWIAMPPMFQARAHSEALAFNRNWSEENPSEIAMEREYPMVSEVSPEGVLCMPQHKNSQKIYGRNALHIRYICMYAMRFAQLTDCVSCMNSTKLTKCFVCCNLVPVPGACRFNVSHFDFSMAMNSRFSRKLNSI